MTRGEIYNAQLRNTSQNEYEESSLVVIVSSNANNRSSLPTLTVVPVVPHYLDEVLPFETSLQIAEKPAKAQAQGIITIPKAWVQGEPVGRLDN